MGVVQEHSARLAGCQVLSTGSVLALQEHVGERVREGGAVHGGGAAGTDRSKCSRVSKSS